MVVVVAAAKRRDWWRLLKKNPGGVAVGSLRHLVRRAVVLPRCLFVSSGQVARGLGSLVLLSSAMLVFMAPAEGSDRPVLNVLVPLGTLSVSLVNAFEKDTGALVRTGFLSAGTDTDGRVRHDATVWDVVVSDELELRKLERADRLARLNEAASGARYVSLFEDPVGLACKRRVPVRDAAVRLRWQELSQSLVENGLIGEVVLALPEPVHALLADALMPAAAPAPEPAAAKRDADAPQNGPAAVQGPQGAGTELRAVYPVQPSLGDPRIAWLGQLYRETRVPLRSVDAEILSPSVSCVITYFSKYNRLLVYFAKGGEGSLRFYVPGGATIARRLAAAVTEESPKSALARRFVDLLVAERLRLAARKGYCPARGSEAAGANANANAKAPGRNEACSARILRTIDDFPVLPENMARALTAGYRGVSPDKQQGNAAP